MRRRRFVTPPTDGTSSGSLGLPLVAWEGGPNYWSQFSKASAAGWTSDTFFPICIFLGDPAHASAYQAAGINTYMASNHVPPISTITSTGMYVIAQFAITFPDGDVDAEWTVAEIGSDARVVGWFVYDEAEMGEGNFWDLTTPGGPGVGPGSTETQRLTYFQTLASDKRALADGRFLFANFGNGVLRTHWAPTTMADFVQTVDGACIDKYAYTSADVRGIIADASDWTDLGGTLTNAKSSAAYGWYVRQMRDRFDNPADRRPQWNFVETKKPLLGESTATIITHAQMEGAVFSALANEARGIAYFDHNGNYPPNVPVTDPNTGAAPTTETRSIPDGPATYAAAVTAVNAKVTALASVLNTQSHVHSFGASGIDTMLKAKSGFAYIFASVGIGGTTGSKTFTLPAAITGTSVDVLNESRTISVSGGAFTDSFAAEYSHHVYKVAI